METDPSKKPALKRREALLLLELGQGEQAVAAASSLVSGPEPPSASLAFLGDILCRTGRWTPGEEAFSRARARSLQEGRKDKADSLAAGPLFLLAEAREDYGRCLELSVYPVLSHRARRLSGERMGPVNPPKTPPWRELFLLEKVHSGEDPSLLHGILDQWRCGEGEWRWRILYEGALLSLSEGTLHHRWRNWFSATGGTVLDPRYFHERKELKELFSRAFVKKRRR